MSRTLAAAFVFLACVLLVPSTLLAQSAITGVVKDPSGAVLPGVTVEASSDVLIERVRSVVSDGQGVYRIVELRPGTYTVTFTLPGFNSFKREGLVLPSEFTATVNAELRVGTVEETITVTAESPVVDVTTAVHTQVLDREAIDAIPTGRSIQGMAQLIPGINMNLPDTGGARAMQQTYMSTRGMTLANNTVMVDGMMVNGLQLDGGVQSYFNDAMNAEVSYQTSGIGADTAAGGVRLNLIPREGGNRFSGDYKLSYRPGDWQSSNLTDRHQAVGLSAGNAIDRIIDTTFAQGGPIIRDKLWFFASARYFSVNNFIANTFFDDGSQGLDDQFTKSAMARITWQITPRNKLSGYFDEIDKYRGHDMQSNDDPETAALQWFSPAYHTATVKWTSTVSSRLLLETGWSSNLEYYTNNYQDGVEKARFTPEWFASASRVDLGLGGRSGAGSFQTTQSPERQNLQASASYVTGAHNFKLGFQYTWGDFWHTGDYNGDIIQQYRGCDTANHQPTATCARPGVRWVVPDSVIIRNTPLLYGERLNRDVGIYAQDSWRIDRLTLNAGVRWENVKAQVLASDSGQGRWVPARSFPEIPDLPDWKDWAPRFATVYDLFGNGKTAVKYSVNRYNQIRTTGIAASFNPVQPQGSPSLPWTDLNGNDIAEGTRTVNPNGTVTACVYLTPGCEINFAGVPSNFGVASPNQYGGFPRTWNLENSLEVQHELLPRLSISGVWTKGGFHNLTSTNNAAWTAADYTPYTFYHPLTGDPFQVFARSAEATRRPARNVEFVDKERKRQYESLTAQFNWRMPWGGQLFGGGGVERERFRGCTSSDDPNYPNYDANGIERLATTQTYTFNLASLCDEFEIDIPWRKGLKLSGTVPVGFGIDVSMALQSNESPTSSRQMQVTTGVTRYPATCPGACPAGQIIMPTAVFGQPSLTINLEAQRATAVERITQLDLKVTRTFRMGRVSVLPVFEVFNVNNSDAIISFTPGSGTNVLNTNYLRPNSIMQGRMYGVGVTTRW